MVLERLEISSDNHSGVFTHLEPDILEYNVKCALRSTTINKDRGGDRVPAELFQTLKNDAVKVLCSICQKFGKLSSGHRTGKVQSQRRAIPKSVQTTTQLHLFHTLARLCSKSFKRGFSSTWIKNFHMFKLGLEKAEEPEIKLPIFIKLRRKLENSRKISSSALLTMLKPLTVWIIRNCGKVLKKWEYQTTLPVFWETCMQVKKQ